MMTLRCSLIPLLSAGESRLGQASDAEPRYPEEAARQELRRDFLDETIVHRRVLHTAMEVTKSSSSFSPPNITLVMLRTGIPMRRSTRPSGAYRTRSPEMSCAFHK